jgi:hypothetical protein
VLAGEIDRLVNARGAVVSGGGDYGLRAIGLGLSGRRDEARAALDEMRDATRIDILQSWIGFLTAWLDRRPADMTTRLEPFRGHKIQDDPEAMFQEGWLYCDAGGYDEALPYLQRAVAKGYAVAPTLANSRHFDPLRETPAFQALLAEAEAARQRAHEAFKVAGGERLLAGIRIW